MALDLAQDELRVSVVYVDPRRRLNVHFQGEAAKSLADRFDLPRIRRAVRPLMQRPALIIVHANRRCKCATGSWYGRCRNFTYYHQYYTGFNGDVITLVVNPRWLRQKRVVHGPYYLAGSNSFRRYPSQRPMDALIYVLAHEFAHHYLYARRHPLRFSEPATDLFAVQHLCRVEPRHPIARRIRLTNAELRLLLELLERMPPPRRQPRRGPVARRAAARRRRSR